MAKAEDDRPLDMDWNAEALETDSFTDVVTQAEATRRSISSASNMRAASLAEHLLDQLHGAGARRRPRADRSRRCWKRLAI